METLSDLINEHFGSIQACAEKNKGWNVNAIKTMLDKNPEVAELTNGNYIVLNKHNRKVKPVKGNYKTFKDLVKKEYDNSTVKFLDDNPSWTESAMRLRMFKNRKVLKLSDDYYVVISDYNKIVKV